MSKVTVHGPRVTSSIEIVAAIRISPGIVRERRWTNRLAGGIVRNEAPRIMALQVPADASVDVTSAPNIMTQNCFGGRDRSTMRNWV
jgi:hypothetical protein